MISAGFMRTKALSSWDHETPALALGSVRRAVQGKLDESWGVSLEHVVVSSVRTHRGTVTLDLEVEL